jgi:hypothetical protein
MKNSNDMAMQEIAKTLIHAKTAEPTPFNAVCQQIIDNAPHTQSTEPQVTQAQLSEHPIFEAIRENKYISTGLSGQKFKIFHENDFNEVQAQLKDNKLSLTEGFYADIIRFEYNRMCLKMLLMCRPTSDPKMFIFKETPDAKKMGIFTFS